MINMLNYGFLPEMIGEEETGIPARITAVHKERYEIICEYGETYGQLKRSVYYNNAREEFPTTGDFVMINYISNGDSQIIKTLPRKSFFSRSNPSPGRGEQAVAANFDYVFIMQSFNHDFNIKRLERYLTLSWQSGAVPVVILTKSDLVDDYTAYLREVECAAVGIEIFAVSAKTGYGFNDLSEYLRPKNTIVFLGSSGVGKSSLVNALAGEEIMAVKEIRKDDSRGRHTTTHRQLVMLNSGVMIIDTPGMRELGMWDVSNGLGEAFADVEQYFGQCKFSDCKHQTEPDCAIKIAIEKGGLSRERWESYLRIKKEAKFTEDKGIYRKRKKERGKDIAKWNKAMKKNGGYEN